MRSRHLRRNAAKAEQHLWNRLRDRQLKGAKFRRQVPVDRSIVDFLCERAEIIVELDGGQHHRQAACDSQRTAALEAQGFIVLRFWNNEVLSNTDGVLQEIGDAINAAGHPSAP